MDKLSEISKVVADTQNLVLEGFQGKAPSNWQLPGWVDHILQVAATPDEIVKATLGVTGEKLKRFAVRVNLEHPDLVLFTTEVPSLVKLFAEAADFLSAAKDTISEGKVPSSMEETLLANKEYPKILRVIHQPTTRLLTGIEDRKDQRNMKKEVNNVTLKTVFATGENFYFSRPSHFMRYTRNSKYCQVELAELNKRHDLFLAKNMNELAHSFAQRMQALTESMSDILGFYRLRPDEAAVTLARLHGFKWNDSGVITIPSKCFDSINFFLTEPDFTSSDPDEQRMDDLKRALILNTRFVPSSVGTIHFNYQPRMYPLPTFSSSMPEQAQKIVDSVEHLEALNGNPFFDYYWVLVPSINIDHPAIQRQKNHWTIHEHNANTVYSDYDEAVKVIDTMLVKAGCIVPVVIGERDGKCYFVCMWA